MFSLAGYYSARVLALFWWFSKWPILFGQILGKLIAYACIQILTVLKKVYPQSKNYHLFILLLTSECLHAQKTTGTSAGDHQCQCASLCVLQQSRFTTHKCTGHLEVIHRGVLGKGLYHISLSYIAWTRRFVNMLEHQLLFVRSLPVPIAVFSATFCFSLSFYLLSSSKFLHSNRITLVIYIPGIDYGLMSFLLILSKWIVDVPVIFCSSKFYLHVLGFLIRHNHWLMQCLIC